MQFLVEGDDDQVSEFQEIAKTRQPKAAEVAGIALEDYQDHVESVSKFSFRFQSLQVSKGIESILRIEKMQETMLGKQDQMLGNKIKFSISWRMFGLILSMKSEPPQNPSFLK